MVHDGVKVAVKIINKFMIKPVKLCYRLVYNYPFLVGILLMVFFLYRSFPFLFQLFVSFSPVIVCTAVLLGALLSFGDDSISSVVEEDEGKMSEIAELRTGVFESRELFVNGEGSGCVVLVSEIVERSVDEAPLIDVGGRDGKDEIHADGDVGVDSLVSCRNTEEVEFGKEGMLEVFNEIEPVKTREVVDLGDCESGVEVDVDVGSTRSREVLKDEVFAMEKVEVSADVDMMDGLESCMAAESGVGDNLENHETDESIENQMVDQLESSSRSWTQFDVSEHGLSPMNSLEDYISGEGSVDAQIGSPLELSLGSWNHFDSDHDGDDESGSDSDGAESSSPDASLADIIPMLDELHPLLEEDENPLKSNLSSHGSIHSNNDSDQQEDDEAGDVKSDGDENGKEDSAKSVINWTEEDQKNFMELGTSDLERNQRLESLIARRRARRMVSERTLLDLEGMDLSFPIAPISTARYNPFDNSQDSYADLGLPPIPGSAPSIMVQRRNPFDLPYDSSEEKPDLTGDSFQEEFMEIGQREKAFKRNETFSAGSSIFDFGRQTTRATRFRPYFVPERTDSDAMSYSSFERQFSELSESRMSNSSLQRQSSELSESKASSAEDTDMTYTVRDRDENNLFEHEGDQERELSPPIGYPSDNVEHGSQCIDDTQDVDHHLPVIEAIVVGNSVGATTEATQLAGMRVDDGENDLEVDDGPSESEASPGELQSVGDLIEINHSSIDPSLPVSKEHNGLEQEDGDKDLGINKVRDLEVVDTSHIFSLEALMSDVPNDRSLDEPESGLVTEVVESHPKEPTYDSSPVGINRNLLSSFTPSDLQRETSEIDLYHVQRDLFSEDIPQRRRQGPYDDGDSVNEVNEVTGYSSTKSHFKKELLDDESPLNEAEKILTEGDKSIDLLVPSQEKQTNLLGDHVSFMEANLSSSEITLKEETGTDLSGSEQFLASVSSKNNLDSDASRELLFALDEAHFLPHDSLIYDPQNQVQSVIRTGHEEIDQANQVDETSNILKVQEPEDPMLSSLLQDDESFSHLENVENISFSGVVLEKNVEDITEGIQESVADDLIISEEITDMKEFDEDFLSELDAVGDFSVNNESLNLNRSYLDDEVDADIPEVVAEVHSSSGKQFGDNTLLQDITDAQMSESVSETSKPIVTWRNESISDSHMRDISDEVTEMREKDIQPVVAEDIVSEIPYLHLEDADVDIVTLEHQSVEDKNDTLKNVSEEEAQNSLVVDLSDVNLAYSEEPSPDSPLARPLIETTLNDNVSVEERSESDHALLEGKLVDSSRLEPDLGISVDTEISELSGEDFEDLETYTKKSFTVCEESLPLPIDTDSRDVQDLPVFGNQIDSASKKVSEEEVQCSLAAEPVQVEDTDLGDMNPSPDSPQAVPLIETTLNDNLSLPERNESNLALAERGIVDSSRIDPGSGISVDTEISKLSVEDFEGRDTYTDKSISIAALETTAEPGKMSEESLPLPLDTDDRDMLDSLVLGDQIERSEFAESPVVAQACTSNSLETEQIEFGESVGSDSMQNGGDLEETLDLPADKSNTPAVELMVQRETVDFVKPQSESQFQTEADSSVEYVAPVIEATVSVDDVSEDHFQNVVELQTVESNIDRDFRASIQESAVVEASVTSPTDSEDQRVINSQMETVEVCDLPDNLLTSHPKPEVGTSISDDFEGTNVVSSAIVSPPNKTEEERFDESMLHVEEGRLHETSSQVEEERHTESHLEFSSSSSSSSSSSISHEV